jgi:type I restriction enzyme R subunit
VDLANMLSAEQRRAADGERVKLTSQSLLDSVRKLIAPLERWTEREQTQAEAEVEVFILDFCFQVLPTPPSTDDEKQAIAKLAYRHIWQQSIGDRRPHT